MNSENRLPLCNVYSIRIFWLNGKHPLTPFRSIILPCQRSPNLVNIQLRRLLIGIHRQSRGLQLTSAASLYNKQRKHKDSIVKDRKSRNEEFWNIHELESAIHLSRKEQ